MKNFINKIIAKFIKPKPIKIEKILFTKNSFADGLNNVVIVLASILKKNELIIDVKKNSFDIFKVIDEKKQVYSLVIKFYDNIIYNDFINYVKTTKNKD